MIEKQDFLCSIYACTLEYHWISDYWNDWSGFEELLLKERTITEARIDYWLRRCEYKRKMSAAKYSVLWKHWSPELESVHFDAAGLAQPEGAADRSPVPVTLEHLLLAAARRQDLQIGRDLVRTGLDPERLERALKTVRRGIY